MKKITILGSTGSIGTQTLDVVSRLPDDFEIYGLATLNEVGEILEQIKKFRPRVLVLFDPSAADELKNILGKDSPEILSGKAGLLKLASRKDADIVVNAIVGAAGLEPSLAAIRPGVRLCTANKESLVIAGHILMPKIKETGAELIPIDSEHSALLQASFSGRFTEIKKLILTASGGPFFGKDVDLEKVSAKDALAHPNWAMGAKISIDSATMMNKGLEVIEAHWLFGIPPERIEVLIHLQSIIHSIVEFVDGSQIAQASVPDMRLPIQYALTYPERRESPIRELNLSEIGSLTFFEPDYKKFPCLKMAYDALSEGGSAPCVMNAANEAAVSLFLQGRMPFSAIPTVIDRELHIFETIRKPSIEAILRLDTEVRADVFNRYNS